MVRGNVFSFFLETLALKVYVYPRGINFKNIKPIKDGQFQNMAVTSLRWRWCLLLVLLCMLPSSSVNLSSICCFQDNDTRLERLGSNSTVLIVDSFFCPAFLEFLEQFSASATDHVIDDVRSFPGWRIMFDLLRQDQSKARLEDIKTKMGLAPGTDHEFVDALLWGHYLRCVGRASAAAGFGAMPRSNMCLQSVLTCACNQPALVLARYIIYRQIRSP